MVILSVLDALAPMMAVLLNTPSLVQLASGSAYVKPTKLP